ncbi:winged helix-turn-helix transcriptional regulator [Pseudooceanicola sp. MF1-13]|uniref:winged helix-turn-helix transcriptional regulator n=1 Tax=Pseudooceanicola sp. MF1-13 TaxID=3379095 RepID=UPI0038927558
MIPPFDVHEILHNYPCEDIAATLSLVGDKWSMLIVMYLSAGPCRFNELKRKIGSITQRMLTLTLRKLEREGLVIRTIYPEVPPRVEYALTDLGHSLFKPVQELGLWALSHQTDLKRARAEYDRANPE